LTGHADRVLCTTFSPDGSILASGSGDGTVMLYDVVSGTLQRTLSEHKKYVNAISFSPDGVILASGSTDGTVKLWRIR
jgi:WD40 repeat protein